MRQNRAQEAQFNVELLWLILFKLGDCNFGPKNLQNFHFVVYFERRETVVLLATSN